MYNKHLMFITGADPGGAPGAPLPKIGKKYEFLA